MKFVLAPDSFKESMTSMEACNAMERGIKKVFKDAECIKVPMADGGEGTVEALVHATFGRIERVNVTGPLGNKVEAFYGVLGNGKTAVIEMASASGIQLVKREERNPLITTTFGTGELIKAALDQGIKHLVIGIGGSATNDGGCGMLQALGGRLLDKEGNQIAFGGRALKDIESRYGTYLSLGNHDFYTGEADELENMLSKVNVNVLRDEITLINDSFYLIGRDDATVKRYNGERDSLNVIKSSIDNFNSDKPVIVIDHNPQYLDESISNNIDLQVSGHTHKGQLSPINLITDKLFDIDYGLGKFQNTSVVVTSGFGTWGPPIRIGSSSEIVMIKLHN